MNEQFESYTKNDETYRRAKERVEEIKGFYIHLAMFFIGMTVIIVVNFLTSPNYFWFVWPLLGWGIGIVSHGVSIFGFFGLLGKKWEERKIKQIVENERSEKQHH